MDYDFCGWATKANLKCSDGRTILKDAFKHNDGKVVPLVWNHRHTDPTEILGHALLENREEGVYAYGKFNETESGRNAKLLVEHGDITAMSIYANALSEKMSKVIHGNICEVSLVVAGANPGASIQNVIKHGGIESNDEAYIFTGDDFVLSHADNDESEKETDDEETVAEVFDSLTEKQKNVMYAIIGQMLDEESEKKTNDDEGENAKMKHNIFDNDDRNTENTLTHSQMETIISDGKRYGSLKESFLAHAEDYGIDNIEYLFPDARNVENTPTFISRDMGWVGKVMSGIHKVPFSRIKSIFADITEDEARAKGYLKGNLKKEEVFSLLKRSTTPTTIYKKQKLDRDDIIDITDFDVVAWLKTEMRMMLNEEIARAILIGDGRLSSSDDKINEQNIRPIVKDESLYAIKTSVDVSGSATSDDVAKAFIRAVIKSRKNYKGSGTPSLFTTEDMLTDLLLLEDNMGRIIYDSQEKLAMALRVKEIVVVPPMENLKNSEDKPVLGIVVNLSDYSVGADKGGAVNMFDDFDIDYNANKYLIETRCSGALTKPYSAIVLSLNKAD